jgi:outer membrane protein assembly factor BamB
MKTCLPSTLQVVRPSFHLPNPTTARSWAAFGLLFLGGMTTRATADDWPRFMGPKADGVWRESGIISEFPEERLRKIWEFPVAGGYSGPAVSQGRLFVMDFSPSASSTGSDQKRQGVEGIERILCVSAQTGEELWRKEYATNLKVSYPGGPRSTCYVDGDRVYAQGTMGQLYCLSTADGRVIWEKDIASQYETQPPLWGYASHPLVVGELVLVAAGGKGTGIVALDKSTGEERWTSVSAREIGYAPLVVAQLQGKSQLVVWYDVALAGLDLENGKELWNYAFPKAKPQRPIVSIVPPHVNGNRIFITNFYHGSALVEVTESGVAELWSTEDHLGHKDDINSIMSTVIAKNGCYFGVAGNGELRCVAESDGELKWRSYAALATEGQDVEAAPRQLTGFPSLFITPQADRYWLFTDQGDLLLTKLSVDGYTELGRQNLLPTTGTTRGRAYVWCAPAFSGGCIFVRNEETLACFDLRAASY